MTCNDDDRVGMPGKALTLPEDFGLIPPGGGPDEPDPEWDPAWNWWDGMTVQDIVNGTGPACKPGSYKHRIGKDVEPDGD